MSVSVAIVGTGPAGFYTAEALLRQGVDCTIDLIDRLPTPYGLIRFGVAPDHQTTKKVVRNFEKTALHERCRFFGNVELGRDVTLEELRGMYDAVVLAVGAADDRRLGIPGEDKQGVIGSAAFVGWYNAHPDLRDLAPLLDTPAAVVAGNGNVAIDVARVLVKTAAEMMDSDLPEFAARAIQAAPIRDVYVVGRRGPVEARFTNVELREMGHLDVAQAVVNAQDLPEGVGAIEDDRDRRLKEKNLSTLREFAAQPPGGKARRVHFLFHASPVEILGGERAEGVRFERTRVEGDRVIGTGETFDIACGLVIPAIGYRSLPVAGAPFDARKDIVVNQDGRVAPGLYVVGWLRRGPSGVIATNRPDGAAVAQHIATDIPAGARSGRAALEKHLAARGVRVVSFADWQTIEQAEFAAASAPAPRRKLERVSDMLALLEKS